MTVKLSWVKPAKKGLLVPMPVRGNQRRLRLVNKPIQVSLDDPYWARRLIRGDIVTCKAPVAPKVLMKKDDK